MAAKHNMSNGGSLVKLLKKRALLLIPVLVFSHGVKAEAFKGCPTKAFLTQGSIPKTYAVNLVTGDYNIVANDMGVTGPVNGIGFNPADNFAYGWSYKDKAPVRIHADMSVEILKVKNIAGTNKFHIGDMHPKNGNYYIYRQGYKNGLFRIDLNPESSNYLTMALVIDADSLNLDVADMAISPIDGMAYALDHEGILHQIDLESGASRILADTNEEGGYGASYFDIEGNFYAGRNNDGMIFKIAIAKGDLTMQRFAQGPSSSVNDGWRCAIAPLIDVANAQIDFGDAPASYGTSLAENGARHGLTANPGLYLGSTVDGESDAAAFPLSDDENGILDDDDGVQFVTAIVGGRNAVAVVKASKPGYLNAWIDSDRNGTFDTEEQVSNNHYLKTGKQSLYLYMPSDTVEGESWARFRLSSAPDVGPTGGTADGEVEDYRVKLIEESTTVTYYPTSTGWTTLAFEDNWPHEGDYDMNDMVVYMRSAIHKKNAGITRFDIKAEVAAIGAAFHNGFAVRLPGIKRSMVDADNIELYISGKPVTDYSPLEYGRDEAIIIVTYNMWDFVGSGELCYYYRTEPGCGSDIQMTFSASIPLLEAVPVEVDGLLDPFLFATPGAWHGDHYFTAPGRSYEIHLKNQAPTEAFDTALFEHPGDDVSVPEKGLYYQTSNGLPWALEIGTRWDYPIEYRDVNHAYPQFQRFAESNGQTSSYWYNPEHSVPKLIFEN